MKQRVVIRVEAGKRKYHTKALQIAVGVPGVEAVALQGEQKNQLTVIGDGIDAVSLTTLLRKKLGFAQLMSVIPYHEMENWEDFTCRPTVQPIVCPQQSYHAYMPPYYIHDVGMNNHDSCVIL